MYQRIQDNSHCCKDQRLVGMKKYARFPKGEHVEMWVGISTDEVFRVKESRFWWQKNRWPLIEKKMSREDCIEWYSGKDYKTPAKSSCIGCPYHDDSFWLDMKNNRPDEFENACSLSLIKE